MGYSLDEQFSNSTSEDDVQISNLSSFFYDFSAADENISFAMESETNETSTDLFNVTLGAAWRARRRGARAACCIWAGRVQCPCLFIGGRNGRRNRRGRGRGRGRGRRR